MQNVTLLEYFLHIFKLNILEFFKIWQMTKKLRETAFFTNYLIFSLESRDLFPFKVGQLWKNFSELFKDHIVRGRTRKLPVDYFDLKNRLQISSLQYIKLIDLVNIYYCIKICVSFINVNLCARKRYLRKYPRGR